MVFQKFKRCKINRSVDVEKRLLMVLPSIQNLFGSRQIFPILFITHNTIIRMFSHFMNIAKTLLRPSKSFDTKKSIALSMSSVVRKGEVA